MSGPALPRPAEEADPRAALSPEQSALASRVAYPQVARARGTSDNAGLAMGALVAVLLGGATFWSLSQHRTAPPPPAAAPAPLPTPTPVATPFAVPPQAITPAPRLPMPPVSVAAISAAAAPAMVFDGPATAVATAASPSAGGPKAGDGKGDDTDLFLQRANASADVATAEKLGDARNMIVQGTLISAILETEINTDLPGYARAVVTQDVRSFDGSRVLIPRYSRLIGQYKSGLAAGQTRAYVTWSRLIRPDGVSIALGSPGVDFSGQGGLSGKVNSHFFQRYASSILLSVITGLASASSSSVVVSTGQSASTVAAQRDSTIPPTVRVPQGQPIRVFTARDLDFSAVSKP